MVGAITANNKSRNRHSLFLEHLGELRPWIGEALDA
jgi:hypothetical protein